MRARPRALLVDVSARSEADLDPQLRALVAEVRDAGLPVVIDTTAQAPDPPAPKPARQFFLAVCAALAVPPDRCLLLDSEDRNVRAARAAGLAALRWTGPQDVPYLRAALRG